MVNATQTMIDLWKGFGLRNPAQMKFLESPAKYRLLSSGYGGGKSKLGCRESIRHAVQYPGSRNMVSRLHYPDLKRSTYVTFMKELREMGFQKGRHYKFHEGDMVLTWLLHDEHQSQTIFTNLDDEEKFGSVEASTWFIDEGSEVPDSVYHIIFPGRLRWHLPSCEIAERMNEIIEAGGDPSDMESCGCPSRGWVCTNPGASGYLRAVTRGKRPDWDWVPVPPGANIYNPPGYNDKLARDAKLNGDHWYKRYVEGSWDAFEGQRFPMLSEHAHLTDDIDRVSPSWTILEGWDFGWRNDTHVTWLAVDPTDEIPPTLIADYAASEREPKHHAAEILRVRARFGMKPSQIYSWGDPAGRAKSNVGRSYIDEYHELGIHIAPCDHGKSPHYRADHIAKFLLQKRMTRDRREVPGLLVCRRCEKTWESLVQYRVREVVTRSGQDPVDAFQKVNDHGVDSLGYGIINVPPPTETSSVATWNPHKGSASWNRPPEPPYMDSDDW